LSQIDETYERVDGSIRKFVYSVTVRAMILRRDSPRSRTRPGFAGQYN
jgi:hypothetical protein